LTDCRTKLERWLDNHIGLPLYYCSGCQRPVKVVKTKIHRKCDCTDIVNAPRKVFLHGAHDKPSLEYRLMVKFHQIASSITGRNV